MEETALIYKNDMDFLQLVSDICGLPCFFWSDSVFWNSSLNVSHPCSIDKNLIRRLESDCPEVSPGIHMESDYVFWGLLRLGTYYVGIGPALCNEPEKDYDKRYALEHGFVDILPLRKTGFEEMAKLLSLLSWHFLGHSIPYDQIASMGEGSEHRKWISEADMSQYRLFQSEYNRDHKAGQSFEGMLADAVRRGDIESIKQIVGGKMPSISEVGKVADEERKQMEYMVVSLLTILTRAAVEGGMRPETAHELGDIYLRRLSFASSHGGAYTTLALRAITEFAEGVHEAQVERSSISHVEACKTYIDENLLKNIQVGDIAPALGLSRTYLAHLFKREAGMTIQQYIQREKCRKAEKLLIYSDYSIALISEYYGFSSPGYFGTCFRNWYGMTPARYRQVNSKK